jgi:Fic family protein
MLGRVIRGSNSIEGYVIPKDEVVAAAEGEKVEANDQTRLATETYRRAMTQVIVLSTDPDFRWTPTLIKSLHYTMLEYDPTKWPGKWRGGPIYVVDEDRDNQTVYEGPNAELAPSLMGELVDTLNLEDTATPEIVRAAMAHLNLVMIHPFKDGNGRMARCVQTLVLGRAGTLEPIFSSIEEYLGTYTRDYYDVLSNVGAGSWHPQNDALPWVRFCLKAHYYQAQTLLRRARESEHLMNALEETVRKADLPERMRMALWDAAQGFKVRNATYRSAAEVNAPIASRDLNALVVAGFLEPQGEKKARHYTATPKLLAVHREVSESRFIPDPYEETRQTALFPLHPTVTSGQPTTFTNRAATLVSTGPKPPSEQSGSEPEE